MEIFYLYFGLYFENILIPLIAIDLHRLFDYFSVLIDHVVLLFQLLSNHSNRALFSLTNAIFTIEDIEDTIIGVREFKRRKQLKQKF